MIRIFVPLSFCFLAACSITPHIEFKGLTSPKTFMSSKLDIKSYPSYMAGPGNIYSCRYGIFYKEPQDYSPPRDVVFSGLLYKYLPGIKNHKVELMQFDIYLNQKLKLLHVTSNALGSGAISQVLEKSASRGYYGFADKNFLIDSVPDTYPVITEELQVGCKDANEGEYYQSTVSGGHDVIVGWYKFNIDCKRFQFRTQYQFQINDSQSMHQAFLTAIDLSVQAIASKIKI